MRSLCHDLPYASSHNFILEDLEVKKKLAILNLIVSNEAVFYGGLGGSE